MEYEEFLKSKQKNHIESGFEVNEEWLNSNLFPFQSFSLKRALKTGRFALWFDCGLGKTICQLSWAYCVAKHTGKPVLVLAPLAVVGQTIQEGDKFGIELFAYNKDCKPCENEPVIFISNYEQLDNIDCSVFSGIVLDESGILKNFSGETKKQIIELFQNTQYKLACSATPSPNDELELGNHAEFLNVMSSQDMRAMFFTTDKDLIKGDKYRLKKHSIKDFYKWISTWAIMISKPSDIGFSDEGYNLPGINYNEINITTEARDNGLLFNSASVSATNFNAELRLTKINRMDEVAAIVNGSTEMFLISVKQNEEADYLRGLIHDAIEVRGSDDSKYKCEKLLGFGNSEFRVLLTKAKIVQYGMNYQNCHNIIIASPDFSFEGLYQFLRRCLRFGQKEIVNAYIITTDTMQNVIASIKEKEQKFLQMQKEMREAILLNMAEVIEENKSEVVIGKGYKLILGDCVDEVAKLPDNSIDYSFFSPPFGALYVFSNNPKDMSNVRNNDEFMVHFKYLIKDLFRVVKSGRLVSIHMMQSTTLLGRDGYYSIIDFRGDLIRLFQECGFYFHAENMIRKDPKMAAIRTKNRQLMWGTTKKDSAIVRPGLADYILTFQKPGVNEVPIQNNIPFDLWCKIAEPVWIDVNESDTLDYRDARDNNDERHITPTQLTPIEWCYNMWCNKGEVVLSPFSGVASEGVVALKTGRQYIGIELKKSYFELSVKNCNAALEFNKQQSLF